MKANRMKRIAAAALWLGWMLLGSLPAVGAQPAIRYYFKTLDIQNGLSQNTVNAILQDRNGFLWFGTKDGLDRFDGLSFRVFKKETHALGNNFITALHEDETGKIWVGTDAGVYVYDPLREIFAPFPLSATGLHREDSAQHAVTQIGSDDRGRLWISMDYRGLFRFDPASGELRNFLAPEGSDVSASSGSSADPSASRTSAAPSAVRANVTRFWFDGSAIWVALYDDNLYFTPDTFRTFLPFRTPDGREPFRGDIVNCQVAGPHHRWYIGSSNGLFEVDRTTGHVRRLLEAYVRDLSFQSDEELWVGTESGLYIYDLAKETATHLAASTDNDAYALADNALYAIARDREGGMWIGSYFGGVNYYPRQWTYFEKFYPRDDIRSFGRRVREFCPDDDGRIWIGTEDKGLFRFDPAAGTLQPYLPGEIHPNIHGLCRDGAYLWVGTFAGGLYRINLRTGARRHYQRGASATTPTGGRPSAPGNKPGAGAAHTAASGEATRFGNATTPASPPATGSLDANDVFSLCKTTSGDLWAGTTSGLFRYDRAADRFRRVPELGRVFVYHILEDAGGDLWLATYSNGLYRYDGQTRQWKNYLSRAGDTTSLPYNKVVSLYEDSRRRLWVMTEGAGFCRFDAEREAFIRYDSSAGFPANIVYRMVEDNRGHLWLTTNHGLVCFHPDTGHKRIYTTADGLLSNQFNYQSGYKDPAGRIYLGSINGFITFDPATFVENRFVPPVVLTDFSLFNKRVEAGAPGSPLEKSIVFADRVELEPDQNSFSLQAAALSYQAPEMNRLAYKLEGFDKEWYTLGRSGAATYSNLPYGRYTFRLKGSNSDGRWNDAERRLDIRIRPPFYLSGWAYAVYLLLGIGSVAVAVAYFRRRTRRKHREAMEKFFREKERELYTAKIDFFTNVAHEIRTPLTLIKSPLENVLAAGEFPPATRDDLEIMHLNTHRLLDLVNQLLDFRKTETGGFRLHFEVSPVTEILRSTYARFVASARCRRLDFTLEAAAEIEAEVDREALTKIFSNLFSNAVKYARSYIRVTAARSGDNFTVSVCNDGPPIPPGMREEIFKPFVQYSGGDGKTPGTGIGLALARSLAELHGGSLVLDDAAGADRVEGDRVESEASMGDGQPEQNKFVLTMPLRQPGRISESGRVGEPARGRKPADGQAPVDRPETRDTQESSASPAPASLSASPEIPPAGEGQGREALPAVSPSAFAGIPTSPAASALPARPAGKEETPASPRYTVLVVEDHPEMLAFVARQLAPLYRVLTASNGAEALRVLEAEAVNLVVSDVMMPEMDGLALCDHLKSTFDYSHIPVVLLTAKTTLPSKIDGLKTGADAYIEKPFSVEYLKARVGNLLSNREKLHAAFAHSPFARPRSMAMTQADEAFLETLRQVIVANLDNAEFSLDDMAALLHMSRSSLNRKIKGVLDMTPNDYIRLERLKKAAELLREGSCKVNEVCYRVGFNTPSYFTKCFQKQFGILPKDFVK